MEQSEKVKITRLELALQGIKGRDKKLKNHFITVADNMSEGWRPSISEVNNILREYSIKSLNPPNFKALGKAKAYTRNVTLDHGMQSFLLYDADALEFPLELEETREGKVYKVVSL